MDLCDPQNGSWERPTPPEMRGNGLLGASDRPPTPMIEAPGSFDPRVSVCEMAPGSIRMGGYPPDRRAWEPGNEARVPTPRLLGASDRPPTPMVEAPGSLGLPTRRPVDAPGSPKRGGMTHSRGSGEPIESVGQVGASTNVAQPGSPLCLFRSGDRVRMSARPMSEDQIAELRGATPANALKSCGMSFGRPGSSPRSWWRPPPSAPWTQRAW